MVNKIKNKKHTPTQNTNTHPYTPLIQINDNEVNDINETVTQK